VQNIIILGVIFINGLSVTPHVQHLAIPATATSNAQALYALNILHASHTAYVRRQYRRFSVL